MLEMVEISRGDKGQPGEGGKRRCGIMRMLVGDQGEDDARQHKNEEREFFEEQGVPCAQIVKAGRKRNPPERPDIEQEQKGREDDQDRFGKHAAEHAEKDGELPGSCRSFDVEQIDTDSEQEEKPAEHVFAFGK